MDMTRLSTSRRTRRRRFAAGALAALTIGSALVTPSSPASAAFVDRSIDVVSRGCQTWVVPAGVSSVTAVAVGAAGQTIGANTGGRGDGVTASIAVTPGQSLRVCAGIASVDNLRFLGGASGVALGTDFTTPLIVAGGGGSAGGDGRGGDAGFPTGAAAPGGGGGGTQTAGGTGGPPGPGLGSAGSRGAGWTAAGPGLGGPGAVVAVTTGIGGSGYFGGGGGGGSSPTGEGDPVVGFGGGGGSDFCGAGRSEVSNCTIQPAVGTAFGTVDSGGSAHVKLTWTVEIPDAPQQVGALPGLGSATVSWTPSTTGATATSFTVTATPPVGSGAAPVVVTVAAPTTTASLTGLVGGIAYDVVVVATNPSGDSASSGPVSITPFVAPSISGTAPAGQVGVPYSFGFTVAGVPAPAVSLLSGRLPVGLSLDGNGLLLGIPTEVGTATFTLQVESAAGTASSETQTVAITAAAPGAIAVNGGSGQTANAGQPFASPLSARVTDGSGNPVPGIGVTFAVASGAASFGSGSLTTATTDASGVASASPLTAGSAAGQVTVTATIPTAPSVAPATFIETVTVPTVANRADLSVSITGVPARTARGSRFTATVTVVNAGPKAATLVLTGLQVGPRLSVVSATGNAAIARDRSSLGWSASTLASGATVAYTVTVKAATGGRASDSGLAALAFSLTPDSVITNNLARVSLRLT